MSVVAISPSPRGSMVHRAGALSRLSDTSGQPGRYWAGSRRGEWHLDREIAVQCRDLRHAHDAGQSQSGFEHGEMIPDAGPRAAAEREALPTVPAGGTLGGESRGRKV